jgi:CubicO group peptidase (beta-lactamase class C family)
MTHQACAGERLLPVTERLTRFIRAGEIDGAGLAVAVGGEPVFEWYGGQAAPGLPAGPAVLWPLASISKVYTAAAVMALVERGELTLGTRVCTVLPRFRGGGRDDVTLWHLLTHTSGLIYESPRMEELLRRQTPLDEIVDEAYEHPLQFLPGTRIGYSDYGIALAARVAATVAGRPFPELLRDLVLAPGDLRETFLPPPPDHYPRVARVRGAPAEGSAGAMYNSPYALALAHPAFGVVATLRDLLRFGLLFAPGGPRILSEATVRAMTTDQTGGRLLGTVLDRDEEAPMGWGLGFMVRGATDPEGFFGDLFPPGSFGHAGASGCMLAVSPADGVTVAYVSNRHLNSDQDRFLHRNAVVLNGVLAALTHRA